MTADREPASQHYGQPRSAHNEEVNPEQPEAQQTDSSWLDGGRAQAGEPHASQAGRQRRQGVGVDSSSMSFNSLKDNPVTRLVLYIGDLLGSLLRKIFGKITTRDLDAERKERMQEIDEAKASLSDVENERDRVERDISMKKEAQANSERASRHAQIMAAAEEIKSGVNSDNNHTEEKNHSESEKSQVYEGTVESEHSCLRGIEEYIHNGEGHKNVYSVLMLETLIAQVTPSYGDSGFSPEALAQARKLGQTFQAKYSAHGIDSISKDLADGFITTMAYLNVASNLKDGGRIWSTTKYETVELVDSEVKLFCEEMRASGKPSNEWLGEASTRFDSALQKLAENTKVAQLSGGGATITYSSAPKM